MLYFDLLKEGFSTVNKNWQLVLIQMATMLFSFTAFFIIVGIPIAIAFIIFGLDFTEILRIRSLESLFIGSAELLNKYFAMALVVLLSLIIYVLSVSVMWIFAIGAVAGVLKDNILNREKKFSFSTFFREGKDNFLPVMGFSIVISLLFIIIAFLLGFVGKFSSNIVESARTQEESLAVFLSIFFSLLMISLGLLLIFVALSVTFYGIAMVIFQRKSAIRSLVETTRFIFSKPSSVGFYIFVMVAYIIAGLIVILISSPFTLIPVIGSILSFPFQIINYFIQSYMSLLMIAAMFHFYYKFYYQPLQPIVVEDISSQEGSEPTVTQGDSVVEVQASPQNTPQNPSQ